MKQRHLHRLTLVVGFAVAIMLLVTNFTPVVIEGKSSTHYSFGWPLEAWWFWIFHGGKWHPEEAIPLVAVVICVNIALGLSIVIVAGLSCECLIRIVHRFKWDGTDIGD